MAGPSPSPRRSAATSPAVAIPGVRDGDPQIPELGQQAKAVFARLLERLELQLADHPFVAGEDYSVADIMLLIAVDFGGAGDKRMELELPERVAALGRRAPSPWIKFARRGIAPGPQRSFFADAF